jgi:ribosomal protein L18
VEAARKLGGVIGKKALGKGLKKVGFDSETARGP